MRQEKLISKKIGYSMLSIVGFLFVFCWKTEKELAEQKNIIWSGGYVAKTLGISLVLGILLGCVIAYIMYAFAESGQSKVNNPASGSRLWGVKRPRWVMEAEMPPAGYCFSREKKGGRSRLAALTGNLQKWLDRLGFGRVFAGSFILLVLARIPCYLAYYPAICAYDSPYQVVQIVSGEYIDHHPIAHTLLIKAGMFLGERLLGSVNAGIALYAFAQVIALSAAFALGIAMLHRFGVNALWILVMLVWLLFFPFHMYMSVSMTKDIWFSALFLVQILAMFAVLYRGENTLRLKTWDVALFFSTVGMILFRNNGKYALLVLITVLLLALWRDGKMLKLWGKVFLNCVAAFIVGSMILSLLFHVTNAVSGDKREMLSIPIQQLARCMVYHGGAGVLPEDDNTMSEEDKALLQEFMLYESYQEYNPHLADPVKRNTNTWVVRYRFKDFTATYFGLLVKYPSEFINAFLEVNAGYLYPNDVSHATVNENGIERGLGYVQTRWMTDDMKGWGIYKDSKLPYLFEKMERWADENAYLKIPILKYLFVPGMWLWLCLFLMAYLWIHRRFRISVVLILILGYFFTLLLGPTVQLRYVYPVMTALPFIALLGGRRQCVPEEKCQ